MSDDLIGRADSLMRRSRSFVAGHASPAPLDDGIPLLTEEIDLDALIAAAEPEDRTAEITAQVTAAITAEITERVTAEVTARVTADVTHRVSTQVAEEVRAEVTAHVSQAVAAQTRQDLFDELRQAARAEIRNEVRDALQRDTSAALTQQFDDLAPLIQDLIDDWRRTTLPALVGTELRAELHGALETAFDTLLGAVVENTAARIQQQAALDLRARIAREIEARSVAVVTAALSRDPSEAPDQPL
jgi:hypothetical protein